MTDKDADRKEARQHVPSDEFRQALGDFLDRALQGERAVITRHGKPVAVLVPMGDLARLERLDEDEADGPASEVV